MPVVTERADLRGTGFATENTLRGLSQIKILNGVLIKDVSLGTTVTLVPHLLGRVWNGYIVVGSDASANVFTDTSSSADRGRYLPLKSSGSATFTLWVF